MKAYFVFSLKFLHSLEETVLVIFGIAILFHSKATDEGLMLETPAL